MGKKLSLGSPKGRTKIQDIFILRGVHLRDSVMAGLAITTGFLEEPGFWSPVGGVDCSEFCS